MLRLVLVVFTNAVDTYSLTLLECLANQPDSTMFTDLVLTPNR